MKTILTLDPFTIDPDEKGRLGFLFPAKAEALGILMKADGQNDPIKVVKLAKTVTHKGLTFQWKLVAGLHRLRGTQSAGIEIKAIEVVGDAATLEHIQASENFDRRDMGPLEHSIFTRAVADAARLRLFERHGVASENALGGLSKANRVQFSEIEKADEIAGLLWTDLSTAYGWKEETAKALNLGPKDLQRSLRIHRLIVEPFHDLINVFKDHPVAKVRDSLLKICAIADEAKRREVVECLCGGPADLGYAFQHCGLSPDRGDPEPYRKFSGQIAGGWTRLNVAERRRFLPEFLTYLSAAERDFLREQLKAEEA